MASITFIFQVKLRSNLRQNSNLSSSSTSNLNNNNTRQPSMSTFSASNHNVANHPQLWQQLNSNQRKRNSFSPPSEVTTGPGFMGQQGSYPGGPKAARPTSNGHQHPPSTLNNQRFNVSGVKLLENSSAFLPKL